jgi:2-amino-4-hydroxy-6-hydroxymethyldihydropteridine diphosphokinase
MTTAVLSIGSNLGDRLAHLRGAVAGLGEAVRRVSTVYETPPWGDADQPTYLNAAVLVAAPIPAREWLATAASLERAAGRVRDPARPYGPRSLDVDVIAVWADDGTPVEIDDAASGATPAPLTLPHPRAHLRAFVLVPWLDLDPDAELPGHGSVAALLESPAVAADLPSLVRRDDLTLG